MKTGGALAPKEEIRSLIFSLSENKRYKSEIFSPIGARNQNPTKPRIISANIMEILNLFEVGVEGISCWNGSACKGLGSKDDFCSDIRLLFFCTIFLMTQRFFPRPPFKKTDRAGIISTL